MLDIAERIEALRSESTACAHQLVGLTLALPRKAGPQRRRVLHLMRVTARLSWRCGHSMARLEREAESPPEQT